jgi:sulfate permease, SulP family
LLQTLAAGLVCGFIAVVLSLSLGNLLFFGEMRDFVPIALGMALFTTMVVSAIAALTSPIRGVISISEEIPVVAIAGPAAAITAVMSGFAPPDDIAATIVVAATIATLLTGACLLFLGHFRLGRLIRYVPFPVVAGFLAGTGWLILQGGFSVIAGDAIGLNSIHLLLDPGVALKSGLGVAFAALIAVLQARSRSPLIFPLTLLVALVAYNVVVVVVAIPPEVLQQEGWVVPLSADHGLWPPIFPDDIASVDWSAILSSAPMLPGIILVTVMALLMNATGIELDSGNDIDLDRELRSVGFQNLAAGAGGGVPGYPAVSLSVLAQRLGAANRLVGLVVAAVSGCVLLLGETVLELVPTPLLGSLLVWIGAAVTFEWLILTARRLALWEYLIVFLIFLVIVGVSFTTGILAGLVAAVILFVVEYGRVDSVRHVLTGHDYQSNFEVSEERRENLRRHGDAILIVRLQGFIFFGTSDRLRKSIEDRLSELVRFLIIDFHRVTGVDSSAVVSFVRLGQVASRRGFILVMTGMNEPVRRALMRGGLTTSASLRIDADLDQGLLWCEAGLLARLAPDLDVGSPRGVAELAFGVVKDAALAEALGRYLEPVTLDVGELLVEDGTPSDEMYFVGSGRGAVRIKGSGDVPVRIATIGPGAIVGEIAFYLGTTRNASVVVESPMTAWRFSRTSLGRLQKEMPELASRFHEGLAAMMAARLTSTNRLVSFLAD